MILIPGGVFRMGSSEAEIDAAMRACEGSRGAGQCQRAWFESERPRHEVELSEFLMDEHEVTRRQYGRIMRTTPKMPAYKPEDSHPILGVTWDEAVRYCEAVGGRLPTEAEWEFGARGTDGRRYPWGSQWPPPSGGANVRDEAYKRKYDNGTFVAGYDDGWAESSPAGNLEGGSSPWGLFDMAGNVGEWCSDWFDAGYYSLSPKVNPRGPASGQGRVVRGGAFINLNDPSIYRGAFRNSGAPTNRDATGFRCARNLP